MVCREFYQNISASGDKKGVAKKSADIFVNGTNIIKKNNVSDHFKKSLTHQTAVLRIGERRRQQEQTPSSSSSTPSASSSTPSGPSGAPRQTTLLPHIQRLNQMQKIHLTKKFQTAHHIAVQAKSFSYYEDLIKFNKDVMEVKLGAGYLDRKAGAEMVGFLGRSSMAKQVTEPINDGRVKYYSILNDGSSSAKTMDEKELFLIKTASNGKPNFSVLSLEEIEEADAEGLKNALKKSITKSKITVDRRDHEIGMCTDGAPVNIAMHSLVMNDVGEHLMLILCPNHKIELGIRDAFIDENLNTSSEKNLSDVYYLFKKANLRWRLFKRQAIFQVSYLEVRLC